MFDVETDAATRAWQTKKGLTSDGIVGPASWAAAGIVGKAPSPKPPTPPQEPKPPKPPQPPTTPMPDNVFGLAPSIPEREAQIMAYIASGQYDHEWLPIQWTKNGRTVRALVSRRALALHGPSGEHLIVSTTFPTAQAIGDMIGGAMLTTRMADEIWRQAGKRLDPLTRPWSQDGSMSKTSRMIEQSAALQALAGDVDGLVANEGKDWVVTRRNWVPPIGTGVEKPETQSGSRHRGANFGWYTPLGSSTSPGGERVIQSVGLAHDMSHTDYSQLLRYVQRNSVTVDGVHVDLDAALADPELSPLLQDEGGTMPADRHPDL